MASRDENIDRNIEVPSETEMRKAWLFERIVFAKAVLFILGLVVSYSIVEYGVMCKLMLFLVDENVKGQSLMVSAMIINALDGVSAIVFFLIASVTDVYTNCFNVIVFSTGVYAMGLILLWIAAEYPKEHVMFYVAVILIAIGKSGRGSTLQSFLGDQLRASDDQNTENRITEGVEPRRDVVLFSTRIWWHSGWICGYIVALLALGNSSHIWSFKYPMVYILSYVTGATYLIFYSGLFWYVYKYEEDPPRKPFGINFTKLKPTSLEELFLWASFMGYSMVLSSGNTLFLAQTASTDFGNNPTIVSVSLFFVLKSFISDTVVFLFWCMRVKHKDTNDIITLVRIGAGLICAVLCCVIASKVEIDRLRLIRKEGIQDSTKTSSMSVLWLIPQYCLLGVTEGLVSGGFMTYNIEARFNEPLMRNFVPEAFSEVVLCVGKFGGILVMLIFRDMFGEHINNSRMDRYFMVLAIFSSVFFFFYLVWAILKYVNFKGSPKGQGIQNASTNKLSGWFLVTKRLLRWRAKCRSKTSNKVE